MDVGQRKDRLGLRKPIVAKVMLAFVIVGSIGALTLFLITDTDVSGSRESSAEHDSTATWPTEPPARICGNQSILGGGPTEPPEGAVVVPAGDNSSMGFTFREKNKIFWFGAGVQTLGDNGFS